MAGLQSGSPTPQDLTVHGQSRVLEVSFSDGATFRIPFELMRVYSPSAEVQGHGPGQEVLQTGKREVELVGLEPVGNYAVQPSAMRRCPRRPATAAVAIKMSTPRLRALRVATPPPSRGQRQWPGRAGSTAFPA